jgi:hypothetical protein
MLYRDATGKIIVINRCDYKNDQLYYKQLTALKNDIHKQFSNTPKYDIDKPPYLFSYDWYSKY